MSDRLAVLTIVWYKREYLAFLLIMVFLSLATSSTLPLVTLYLVGHLHVALSLVGLIIGLVVGRRSDRWRSRMPAMRLAAAWVAIGWVIFAFSPYAWLSLAVGVVFVSAGSITIEYLILSFSTALWQVYLTQAMDALVVAAVLGLGLTYAQQLSPGRAGLASSTFGSAFGIATLVGNLAGGVGISVLGVPHLFFIPLATSCIALALFIALDRIATR